MKKIVLLFLLCVVVIGWRVKQEKSRSVVITEVSTHVETVDVAAEVPEETGLLTIRDKGASFKMQSSSKNSPAPVAPENPHLNK